jgi:hypothetical protein
VRFPVLIGALALTLTIPAAAQDVTPPPIPQLVGSVYPAAGGTDAHRIDTTVKVGLTLNKESGATVKEVDFTLPRAVKLSARGFRSCTFSAARHGTCSPRSFVGAGHLSVRVGKPLTRAEYEITIYADGPRHLVFAYTGDEGIVAGVGDLRGHKLLVHIPGILRLTPSDKTIFLTGLELELGPAQAHGRSFAALGSCHGGSHRYAADLILVPPDDPLKESEASATASSPCRT